MNYAIVRQVSIGGAIQTPFAGKSKQPMKRLGDETKTRLSNDIAGSKA